MVEEERALKQKLQERRQIAVAAGYERRSLLESSAQEKAKKCSAARRDSIRSCREARRPSVPDGISSGPDARIDSLMRPTTAYQMRAAEKRKTDPGWPKQEEKKPEESAEEAEEQRKKWEKFHQRSSVFQQNREEFLEAERRKIEDQELEGCTFKPLKGKSLKSTAQPATSSRSSLFERAQLMEAKKQERMMKIRQELIDKEMAQCSFQPKIIEFPAVERDPSASVGSCDGSRRSSFSSCGGERPYSAAARRETASHLGPPRYGYSANSVAYEASEGSEYWDGSRDEEASLAGGNQWHEDVTILPPGAGPIRTWPRASPEVPRPPNGSAASQSASPVFGERAAGQFKVSQRLQERRQLLQDTLSPGPDNDSLTFSEFAAARQMSPSQCDRDSKSVPVRPAGSAGVAEAVERMEALLCGDLSDFDDSSNEWEDEDDLGDSAEAPVLGGKTRKGIRQQPPSSPSRGGC